MTLQSYLADLLECSLERAREGLRFRPIMQMEVTLVRSIAHGLIDELSARYPLLMKSELQMLDRVKNLLRKALPLMEAAAAMTETKLDDEAVKFLQAWLASGVGNIDAFAATYQP